jgi:DNA-binding transcriptional ArsR family regulator
MKAVYIVNDPNVAKILVDPMRRAILDLLRQRPMTQSQLAHELGLTGASLNYHIKKLRSKRLVVIVKKEVIERNIMQIFFSGIAYLFVYDLDSFPKNIAGYFYPMALERARSVVSLYMLKEGMALGFYLSGTKVIVTHKLNLGLLKRINDIDYVVSIKASPYSAGASSDF